MCLTDDGGDRTPVFYTHHKLCAIMMCRNKKGFDMILPELLSYFPPFHCVPWKYFRESFLYQCLRLQVEKVGDETSRYTLPMILWNCISFLPWRTVHPLRYRHRHVSPICSRGVGRLCQKSWKSWEISPELDGVQVYKPKYKINNYWTEERPLFPHFRTIF